MRRSVLRMQAGLLIKNTPNEMGTRFYSATVPELWWRDFMI